MIWQAKKGDDKHCIFGRAVEEGAVSKVADDIKGVHTERQMVIIDEATAVPPAIFDACTNLYSYPREFILVMLGNPRSRLDEFGKFCEPKNGWQAVTIDSDEWETTPKLDGQNGVVIRFDWEKSPNITEGRLVSKHLPTAEKVAAAKRSPGFENNPTYYSNNRGFWPPEGLLKTLFSETSILHANGNGRHTFTGKDFRIIGSLDPARTGDRAMIRFGGLGEVEGGKWGVEWCPPQEVMLNTKSNRPIDYQLIDACKKSVANVLWRGVPGYVCEPKNFGIDSTGGGADLCDIAHEEWSHDIQRIGFGGSASTDACSYEDLTPANERYANKRCEMYHRARKALESAQLKGIDIETAKELCTIEADETKSANSNRGLIVLMSKLDYKRKFSKSPDAADTGIILLQVARNLGFRLAPVGKTIPRLQAVEQEAVQSQELYAQVDYHADNDNDSMEMEEVLP
jgi:hypothetical protein